MKEKASEKLENVNFRVNLLFCSIHIIYKTEKGKEVIVWKKAGYEMLFSFLVLQIKQFLSGLPKPKRMYFFDFISKK